MSAQEQKPAAEAVQKAVGTSASQKVGTFTLAWFVGVIGLFATDTLAKLDALINHDVVHKILKTAKDVSLLGMERLLMGGASLLIWVTTALAWRERKKSSEELTAAKTAEHFAPAVLATGGVVMNTLKLIAAGARSVFGAVGGFLFAGVELFAIKRHVAEGNAHRDAIKKLTQLKKSLPGNSLDGTPKTLKGLIDNYSSQAENSSSKEAVPFLDTAKTLMEKAGFDTTQKLTDVQWLDLAIRTHKQEKWSNYGKAVIHGLMGAGMVAAFAMGHIFTVGALFAGAAIWTTFGAVAMRFLAAITPERWMRKGKLEARVEALKKAAREAEATTQPDASATPSQERLHGSNPGAADDADTAPLLGAANVDAGVRAALPSIPEGDETGSAVSSPRSGSQNSVPLFNAATRSRSGSEDSTASSSSDADADADADEQTRLLNNE